MSDLGYLGSTRIVGADLDLGDAPTVGGPALPSLPFAALNLRRNPFGCPDPEALPELAVAELAPVLRALGEGACGGTRVAVQLLGPPGCGKSTHLAALLPRLPGAALVAWSAQDGWPPLPGGDPLLVDDAQLMPAPYRRRVLGRRRVVLGTQVDLAPRLRARGFRTWTWRLSEDVDEARIRAIVARRIEWARRGPGPLPEVLEGGAGPLLRRHGTDLRSLMGELYDRVQRLGDAARVRHGTPGPRAVRPEAGP